MMADDQVTGKEMEMDTEDYSDLDLGSRNGFRQFVERKIDKFTPATGGSGDRNRSRDEAPPQGSSSVQEEGDGGGDVYDFSHTRRGLAVIINNETFNSIGGFEDRTGSSCDADALRRSFSRLGFDILDFKDLPAWQMVEVLKAAAAKYDHENTDCFACAILSHGDETLLQQEYERRGKRVDSMFGVDGHGVTTEDVIQLFNDIECPRLTKKPRLFFFQACRGQKLDPGQEIRLTRHRPADALPEGSNLDPPEIGDHTDAEPVPGDDFEIPVIPAPLFKDFLVMYATPPGYFAWRRATGSWFIQSLCKIIDGEIVRRRSFINVLTLVCSEVANCQSCSPSKPRMHEKKAVPVIESMLVKDIVFTHKVRQ